MFRFVLLGMIAFAAPARAEEQPVTLLPGPGVEVVQQNCAICHSLDYIKMNSPFLSAKAWAVEVAKMRDLFGAPVSEADAAIITAYLAATYAVAAP
jgi:mono/diheme cytochrome c family protein